MLRPWVGPKSCIIGPKLLGPMERNTSRSQNQVFKGGQASPLLCLPRSCFFSALPLSHCLPLPYSCLRLRERRNRSDCWVAGQHTHGHDDKDFDHDDNILTYRKSWSFRSIFLSYITWLSLSLLLSSMPNQHSTSVILDTQPPLLLLLSPPSIDPAMESLPISAPSQVT